MNAQTEQEPAVAVFLVEGYADPLVVIVGNLEGLLCLGVLCQIVNDLLSIGAEILFGNLDADLLALHRLFQIFDQAFQFLAFLAELSHLNDDLGDEVSAVIQEVILPHSGMTGGFDGQRAVYLVFVLPDGFVNDVLVASLEAEVLTAELLLNELFQTAGGD